MPNHAASLRTLTSCPLSLWRADELPHPDRDLARGELTRVRHGVYAERTDWNALAPWERYLARIHAVALQRPESVFCLESAASLLGLPVIGDPQTVHVLVDPGRAARDAGGVRSHRSSDAEEPITRDGLLTTSSASTVTALARARHPAIGLAVANEALRLDPGLHPEMLTDHNESRVSSRGRRHARWALARATGIPESVLESLSQAVIEWLGFPAPEWQREFVSSGGVLDRGDAWWAHLRLLGEADGELKYDGRFGDPGEAFRRRHERDRRLLAGEVDRIAHWGWHDVAQVSPLRDLLLGQGLRQIRATELVPLRALARILGPSSPRPALPPAFAT